MAVVNPEPGNERKPHQPLLGEGKLSIVQQGEASITLSRLTSFEITHDSQYELEGVADKINDQPEIYTKYTLCLKFSFLLGILCCLFWMVVIIGAFYNEITHFKSTHVTLFIARFFFDIILIGLGCYGIKKMVNSIFKGFRIQEQIPKKPSFIEKIKYLSAIMAYHDRLTSQRIDLRSKIMLSNKNERRLLTVAQEMGLRNQEKVQFYYDQNKIIVKLYNAWIIREWGELLKDIPIDILANILQGLAENNSSLITTAIAKVATDLWLIFNIWYKKACFLTSIGCCICCKRDGCCCCCCCCDIKGHFPIDNQPYYHHFGAFIVWFSRLKWAAGVVQIYSALSSLQSQEYGGLNSLKVFLYCYNFVVGISTIIKAQQDYFLFRYQFCFFWTKEAMTSIENNLFVNKLNDYFSNIGYVFKLTFDKENDRFNRIDDKNLAPSRLIHHEWDCFTCSMCFDLGGVVLVLVAFIVWGTICFDFVGQGDTYSLGVVDEWNCQIADL